MSPQAWPLPKGLTSIITGGMKTSFLQPDSNGTASGSRPRASPDVKQKAGGNEARGTQYEQQDKMQQASQRSTTANARDPAMLARISERNSTSSTMSNMTTQTAADIVKDTQERLGNLGVSVTSCSMFLAR